MQTESTFELLFKKKENNDVSFLKDITEQYPYFAPAHFFLLKGYPNAADRTELAAKTALLFNNPFWLNFQLQGKTATEILKDKHTLPPIETPVETADNILPTAKTEITNSGQKPIQSETLHKTVEEDELPVDETDIPLNKTQSELRMEIPIPPLKLPAFDASKHNMLFEPMHMVDYFASQGIKLSEEIQTGDKLGKQLKSFTEWLKTTKRTVQVTNAEMQVPGGLAENTIQNQAEKSNIEGEVVTESMAEVFAMQGKVKKAIEVYQKLSLSDPSKSAFFAAKINNLKG